jgi:ectoine hydroxylase-related dioxygenase (phytanoyl-CoA dioxygenase family)
VALSPSPVDSDYALHSSLIDSFRRDGHVVVRGLATAAEAEAFRPVIAAVVNDVSGQDRQHRIDDYSRLFTQVTNVWRLSDAAKSIVFARSFASAAAQLLGVASVRLYHDQALFKPAGADRTPWHQDRYYWPLDTNRTVTMWLPLVDVSEEMGPTIFASGSHREHNLGELAISGDTDRRLARIVGERGWPVASATVRAGDATFHAGGTIHSAGANRSDRTREVLTIIYFAAGTRVAEPENENQRVDMEVFLPGLKPGDEAKSEMNPVLYP